MAKSAKVWTPHMDILLFAASVLRLNLYRWQAKILAAVAAGFPAAGLVCNGGGKSAIIIPVLVLWFLYNWPGGRCNVLSGSWDQVKKYVWPSINSYAYLPAFKDWDFLKTEVHTPNGGFATGMSPDDPRRAEGAHEREDSPFLWILDEAKALDDNVIDGIMRATYSFFLITSSAGVAEGRFYDCFNALQSLFWRTKISSFDCPHITDAMRAFDLAYYRSESNPVYRSRHLSEFDLERSGLILSAYTLRRALDEPPAFVPGARSCFCDFGAVEGGDENVMALADGNKVDVVAHWNDLDPVQSVRQFIFHFERLRLRQGEIWADGGGPGAVMIPMLADAGWHVTPVDNGAPAIRNDAFTNRGSEIWFESSYAIYGREWILPNDPTFFEQATSRRKQYDRKMRLQAESKQDMRKRGVSSPDWPDAVFGAITARQNAAFSREDKPCIEVSKSEFARRHVSFR
jgi:hypothetical protein